MIKCISSIDQYDIIQLLVVTVESQMDEANLQTRDCEKGYFHTEIFYIFLEKLSDAFQERFSAYSCLKE